MKKYGEYFLFLGLLMLLLHTSCSRQPANIGVPARAARATADAGFPVSIVTTLKTIDCIDFFGTTNPIFRQKDPTGVLFGMHPDYLGGGVLEASHRRIGVAVFTSEESALAAMEARRNNVAAIIREGKEQRKGLKHWWLSETQALLSVAYRNLIIEISDLQNPYSEVKDELWDTLERVIASIKEQATEQQQQHLKR